MEEVLRDMAQATPPAVEPESDGTFNLPGVLPARPLEERAVAVADLDRKLVRYPKPQDREGWNGWARLIVEKLRLTRQGESKDTTEALFCTLDGSDAAGLFVGCLISGGNTGNPGLDQVLAWARDEYREIYG